MAGVGTARQTLRSVLSNERLENGDEAKRLKERWSSDKGEFIKIGAGACGEVFQLTGTENDISGVGVAKRAKTDEYAKQLMSDHVWHLRILDALNRRREALGVDVLVPHAGDLVLPEGNASWWDANRRRFPARASTLPEVALLAERVMPVPEEARNSLIALFCPETRQEAARKEPSNLDCLIRLYLGKRRPERRIMSRVSMFGLRNFQLYVNDIETIGLDTTAYAVSMARATALMHWELGCDANDVEFVLGGARKNTNGRGVDLWLIDFNRVRAITMDAAGISIATEAFMVNDRYYPRPLDETATGQRLWKAFERAYLEASKRLQQAQRAEGKVVEWEGLPEGFIAAIVEAQEKLLREKDEAASRD